MNRRRRIIIVSIAIIVLVAGVYAVWSSSFVRGLIGETANASSIAVSGNIEAHESVLSFAQVQGPIIDLPFDEGAHVTRGTVLARVDERIYQQQVDIDTTNEQVAAAQVAVNKNNLVAAQNSVTSDQFDLKEKQRDYIRDQQLLKTSAASVQTRDLALTAAQQSLAVVARDQAMVQVATANVTLAQANDAATAAKLKLDEVTLGSRRCGGLLTVSLPCVKPNSANSRARAFQSSPWMTSTMCGCARM